MRKFLQMDNFPSHVIVKYLNFVHPEWLELREVGEESLYC